MKLLHSADWHLGRSLYGVSLIEDQAHVLDQLVQLVRDQKPDAVLIAGDIYDRAVPPGEAIQLLEDVLYRLVLDQKVQVILIAGNHDSPTRLAFGARLLESHGLHILGQPTVETPGILLEDHHGPVHVVPIAFAEPAIVRHLSGRKDVHSHHDAMQCIVQQSLAARPSGTRSIAMAHCFVRGGEGTESERPLSVGGAEMVDPGVFAAFDYVALGHLHRPQCCGIESIRYSGSLMRYSFSEASHQKAVLMVDMDARGRCTVEEIHLPPRRQVRCLQGTMESVLQEGRQEAGREDYVMVTLEDEGPVYDAMGKLRQVYPHVLHVERSAIRLPPDQDRPAVDHRKMSDLDLFSAFYRQVTDKELTTEQRAMFMQVADTVRQGFREENA
jgi:exonuclease SbcD